MYKKAASKLRDHVADDVATILNGESVAASSAAEAQKVVTQHDVARVLSSGGGRQGFERQMAWARQAIQNIEALEQHVAQVKLAYENKIAELIGAEYMEELLPHLHKDVLGFSDMANKLNEHLDRVHIAYISAILQDLGATEGEISSLLSKR